jgi:lysophospholipase
VYQLKDAQKGTMTTAGSKAFFLPPGGQVVYFKGRDGWPLRTIYWTPEPARETILLLNGRGDFIEKYAELIRDLLVKGFAVAAMDWRGQGLSGEMTPPPRRTHIEDFGLWVEDAQLWCDTIVKLACPAPYKLLAHSMGSHLGLRLMHDTPGLIDRAVLLVPMLGLKTHPFSIKFARRVTKMLVQMGQGERFGFGQLPYSALFNTAVRMNRLTSDKARFEQEGAAIAANPALAIGGLSNSWVVAAFNSCELLASPGYAETISTPTLMLTAEREVLVENAAAESFAQRMPNAHCELIADGLHELFRERDAIRDFVLTRVFRFLQASAA